MCKFILDTFDNLKYPSSATKVNYKIFLLCCLLILCESIPWSYRWSGVLSMTQTWGLPRGFLATIEFEGLWPFCVENLYYLNQIQAFLGVEGVSIKLGSVFELQRSLYALLVKSVWFLHPIWAGILVNVLAWMSFCFCIQYIIKTFSPSQSAQAIGGILVASGQGFLQSVGEISPHVIGYGSHYFIFALACRHRIWQPSFSFIDHAIVYATIGILQLVYDSAWLSLPILFPISLYCIFKASLSLQKKLLLTSTLLTLALLPSLSFSMATAYLLNKGGVLTFLYSSVSSESVLSFLKRYLLTLIDGILSYGPIIIFSYLLALIFSLKQKNYAISYLWAMSMFLFFACTILILPVSGRGYVTFSFSAIITLLSTYGLYSLWKKGSFAGKASVTFLLCVYVLYNNSPLFKSCIGNNWVLEGFSIGYLNVLKNANQYRSFECHEFD
jgi:hypothetical protein